MKVLDNSCIILPEKAIQKKWIKGSLTKKEKEKAHEAFDFLCNEILKGKEPEEAAQVAKEKFDIAIECHEEGFSECAIPIYEVRVG